MARKEDRCGFGARARANTWIFVKTERKVESMVWVRLDSGVLSIQQWPNSHISSISLPSGLAHINQNTQQYHQEINLEMPQALNIYFLSLANLSFFFSNKVLLIYVLRWNILIMIPLIGRKKTKREKKFKIWIKNQIK